MARYIFITGGVVSSLGKGLASAALGALLQSRGYKVRLRKLDPYLNLDPGNDVAISARQIVLDLPDRLEERQSLDVADGAADLAQHEVELVIVVEMKSLIALVTCGITWMVAPR